MSGVNIVRVQIRSVDEMGILGTVFGAHFLKPLVEGPDENSHTLVVAAYGASTVGKTTFLQNACMAFPDFYDETKSLPRSVLCCGKSFEKENRRFRWKDFGRYAHGYIKRDSSFSPRLLNLTDKALSQPGFDFLEHPPLPYLDQAHIVTLFGAPPEKGFGRKSYTAGDYFSPKKGIGFPEKIEWCSHNIEIENIAREMRKIETISGTLPDDIPLSSLLLEQGTSFREELRQQFKESSILPTSPTSIYGHRYAAILLTTDNPAMRVAFDVFKRELMRQWAPERQVAPIYNSPETSRAPPARS